MPAETRTYTSETYSLETVIYNLDIIFYNDIISYDEHILIPHPRAHERQFVMKPMCDINPYYVHPIYRKRVMDISSELGEL